MAVIATFLKCLDGTNEAGSNDVYSVAWSAAVPNVVWTTLTTTTHPSLGQSDWSGFDAGEERTPDRLLYPTLSNTVGDVQIVLLEKDNGHDFHADSTETKALASFLTAKVAETPPAYRAVVMPLWFNYAVGKFLANDEAIGFTTVGHSSQAVSKDLTFFGDGGEYRLKLTSQV